MLTLHTQYHGNAYPAHGVKTDNCCRLKYNI